MARLRTLSGYIISVLIIINILAFNILITGCSGSSGNGSGRNNNKAVPAVEAVEVRYGSLPLSERLSGSVKAVNQIELYPQISAEIVKVYVHNGDFVNSGDTLVRLRDTRFREQLKQAEANYQIALAESKQAEAERKRMNSELERGTSLADKELISPTEFEEIQTDAVAAEADADLARAKVKQALATVNERKEELSYTIIQAPVDGTVGNRDAEIGMLVNTNTRLFTLGQLDSVRVEVVLTDRMLSYIEENQQAEIFSPSIPFGTMAAPVARISPFLNPIAHSTIAEIDLANQDNAMKPGMFVTVDIFYGESEQASLVPLSALWENQVTGETGVFVSRDSMTAVSMESFDGTRGGALTGPTMFKFIPVEVIAQGRMSAGVVGVEPGEWVVTIGQDLLGSDSASAWVRPVDWDWIEKLQQLQREDLLQEIIKRQQEGVVDTALISSKPPSRGDAS